MDTIKKDLHQPPTTQDTATAQGPLHANPETMAALGDEPNVTGTDRPEPTAGAGQQQQQQEQQQQQPPHKQPRAGHHHPRQPVGATGLPPNHRPRGDFAAAAAAAAAEAEAGNNFPGTNPHPAHSALGNRDASGELGTLMPGRE